MFASLLATICSAVSCGSPCSWVITACLVALVPLLALLFGLSACLVPFAAGAACPFFPTPSTPVNTPTTPPIAPPSTPPTGPAALLPACAPCWTPLTSPCACAPAPISVRTTAPIAKRNPSCANADGVGLNIIRSPWSFLRSGSRVGLVRQADGFKRLLARRAPTLSFSRRASLPPLLALGMNKASIHNEWDRCRSACDAIAHPIAHLAGRHARACACNAVFSSTHWCYSVRRELARETGSATRNVSSRVRRSLISRQMTAILL